MQSGLLLVDKPEGPTSAQVVGRVKRILGAKKVGHLGTLDPFASGLLPLGIDDGTKIADIFLTARKSYRGVIALGSETDTQDSTGVVAAVKEVPPIGDEEIKKLQEAFTGNLLQTPPMFSALKKEGVRLYRLARKGQTVERAPREIKIESLLLWPLGPTELGFEVTCSKGTYIRTLAADMGQSLGCGAHLKSLRRLACGHLSVENAIRLDDVEGAKARGEVPILSLNQALSDISAVQLEGRMLSRIKLGQQELLAGLGAPKDGEKMLRLIDSGGNLFAIVHWVDDAAGGRWRLYRVFGS
ncbi:MAG: tRNA pseudouridine(55) synthase TruB [Deltaproteobacteria bacterium RIFCSPLOWO2_12_FULL_60_19]|nr:MAG: tRNA pseudouridine(55) synthase TruB [Deltaproteobacteria bacterium RIFCSPLOWO2_12_FULL_60_19]